MFLIGFLLFMVLLAGVFFLTGLVQKRRVDRLYRQVLTADVRERLVDGALIRYRQIDGEGNPLVLIHGFLGSSYDFIGLMPELGRKRPVIAPDLIGFGLSDKSAGLDYSKQHMASLVRQLMLDLGYGHFSVLGHSMGGEVALNLAFEYPELVDRLILLDSAGAADMQQGFRRTLPAWLIEGVFKNYLVQRLYFPVTVADRKLATGAVFDLFFFFNSQIPAATLVKLTLDNDSGRLAGRLDRIRLPALLIWGAKDRIIPPAQGEYLRRHLPDSRFVALGQCGHLGYLEKPAEVLAAVEEFLSATE